jgi:hypothetical protein
MITMNDEAKPDQRILASNPAMVDDQTPKAWCL